MEPLRMGVDRTDELTAKEAARLIIDLPADFPPDEGQPRLLLLGQIQVDRIADRQMLGLTAPSAAAMAPLAFLRT
ncbi:MAG: hypothetical protein HIU85_19850 [Proteobacteria bacterium]|nr:hypothetical protein [Pseudomonadota bacterium]